MGVDVDAGFDVDIGMEVVLVVVLEVVQDANNIATTIKRLKPNQKTFFFTLLLLSNLIINVFT